MVKYTAIILTILTLIGCSEEVCDFNGSADSCEYTSARSLSINPNTIVLVYMPGSNAENIPDPCYPEEINHGAGIPNVVRDAVALLQTKHQVKLLGYCTPTKTGSYDHRDNSGTPKVEKRSEDIVNMLKDLKKAGANPEKIFLIGHSAGGWSSLLAKTLAPELFNSVIAISPAFAGKTHLRPQGWNNLRMQHIQKFKHTPDMQGLVLSMQHDEYENSKTLSFFKKIKNVKLKAIPTAELRSNGCPHRPMHDLYVEECFRPYHKDIAKFIHKKIK